MAGSASTRRFDLVVFGEFFSDMIFYGLRNQPRFGEEVKTGSFLIAPGGGLATVGTGRQPPGQLHRHYHEGRRRRGKPCPHGVK